MPKISELTPVTALDGSETVVIVKAGTTRRASVNQFLLGAVGSLIDDAVADAGSGLITGGAFTVANSGRLLGRSTSGAGRVEEITLGVGLSLTGGVLSAMASGSGTVTSVNASGGSTGLSFTGGPITASGTLTLGGTLAIANGGTGAATAANARSNLGAAAVGAIGTSGLTMATARILGRTSAAAGAVEEISIGSGLSLTAGVLTATVGGTGTVTSVSGTGSVSGLTLSGNVTSSGTLTLGGALTLTSAQITAGLGFTPLQQGGGAGQGSNKIYIGWEPTGTLGLQVDASNFGSSWPISITGAAASAANVTGTVGVANGGTGATNAAAARGNLGAASAGANTDITSLRQSTAIDENGAISSTSIGFRGLPPSSQGQGSTITLNAADQSKMVRNNAGGWIIPANAALGYSEGTTIVLYNNSSAPQTVSINSDTLWRAGTNTAGTRTIAPRGFATLVKVAPTEWVIDGNIS